MSIFISHSSADKPVVRRLAEALRAKGFTVWLDENELRPGHELETVIKRTIETVDWFILVSSASAVKSPWVRKELVHALQDHPDRKSIGLLIARADGVPWSEKTPALDDVDLSQDFERGLAGLIGELERHRVHHTTNQDTGETMGSMARRGLPFGPRPNQASGIDLIIGGYFTKCICETLGEPDIAARATRAATRAIFSEIDCGGFPNSPKEAFFALCKLFDREIKSTWKSERADDQPHIGARLGAIFQNEQEALYFAAGAFNAWHVSRPQAGARPEITPLTCGTPISIDATRRDSFAWLYEAPLGQAVEIMTPEFVRVKCGRDPCAFILSDFDNVSAFADAWLEVEKIERVDANAICRYLTMIPSLAKRAQHSDPHMIAIWANRLVP